MTNFSVPSGNLENKMLISNEEMLFLLKFLFSREKKKLDFFSPSIHSTLDLTKAPLAIFVITGLILIARFLTD